MNVKLATDKPQYLPGQTADYSLEVTDSDGKPAPRAEFSLGVVDEAIYGIRKDSTQDIVEFFFDREWNRVATDDFARLLTSTAKPASAACAWPSCVPPRASRSSNPSAWCSPKMRKAFPDTAFWAADVTTDAAGHAHAKVDFPDSLTTWRATARGVTPRLPRSAAPRSRPSCART